MRRGLNGCVEFSFFVAQPIILLVTRRRQQVISYELLSLRSHHLEPAYGQWTRRRPQMLVVRVLADISITIIRLNLTQVTLEFYHGPDCLMLTVGLVAARRNILTICRVQRILTRDFVQGASLVHGRVLLRTVPELLQRRWRLRSFVSFPSQRLVIARVQLQLELVVLDAPLLHGIESSLERAHCRMVTLLVHGPLTDITIQEEVVVCAQVTNIFGSPTPLTVVLVVLKARKLVDIRRGPLRQLRQ